MQTIGDVQNTTRVYESSRKKVLDLFMFTTTHFCTQLATTKSYMYTLHTKKNILFFSLPPHELKNILNLCQLIRRKALYARRQTKLVPILLNF